MGNKSEDWHLSKVPAEMARDTTAFKIVQGLIAPSLTYLDSFYFISFGVPDF